VSEAVGGAERGVGGVLLCECVRVVSTLRIPFCFLRRWRDGVSVSSALDGVLCLWFMGFLPLPRYFSFIAFCESQFDGVVEFPAESAHDGSECDTVTMARLKHHTTKREHKQPNPLPIRP
jgi:hypothetical protein